MVKDVDTVNGDWIILDTTISDYPAYCDGDTVYVGVAWDSIATLCESYIDAERYTQEVWVNKDLAPTDQWDWLDWSGDVDANTSMKITGFHRVPGDMTEKAGAYFQMAKDMFDNGVDADCLVEIDLSGRGANSVISEDSVHNIRMSGFNFCNGVNGCEMFSAVSGTFCNVDFTHNAFEVSALWKLWQGTCLFFSDCFFEPSDVYTGTAMFDPQYGHYHFTNNYFKNMNSFGEFTYDGYGHLRDNVFQIRTGSPDQFILIGSDGGLFSYDNTFVGFDGANAVIENGGQYTFIASLNDLIYNRVKTSPAFHVGLLGGSFVVKNTCAYAEDGQLDDVMTKDPTSPTTQVSEIVDLLEVDPLLDGDFEPLEEQVRTGGSPDILGDPTAIGAIKTMNTTVINTAVQGALTSQGYTTGRAPYLDALNSGMKLAADGLDNVVVAEPTGDPSGWSFVQCVRWLIMRFFNKHTSDNFSGMVVHKSDGSTSTSQPVTEVDGLKQVGKAQ